MRVDKGGVVDLCHNQITGKKYEVQNLKTKKVAPKNQKPRSMKDRLIACKLLQKWWRDIIDKYKKLTDRLIKLQSVWRGYFVRNNLYEIIYSIFLSQAFVNKFKPVIVNNSRTYVMDMLRNNFACKFRNRLNFQILLRFQKIAKAFLKKLRDKRMKFNLVMEKLIHKIKKDAFETLSDFSKKNNKKMEMLSHFLRVVKKNMRIRIFHSLMFKIFDLKWKRLKNRMRNIIMKIHFNRFPIFFLRGAFQKWAKTARPSEITPAQLANMVRHMRNKINAPFYNELIRRLKKMPDKRLREKLINRLGIRNNKYNNEMILKEFFTKWRNIQRELAIIEFKATIFNSFLFRTSKGIIKRKTGKAFRLWHYKSIAKVDLEKVNEFLENLKKPIRRHSWNACIDHILYCTNGIKARTTKALYGLKGKFHLLKLRNKLNLWKRIIDYMNKVELKSKLVFNLKSKNLTLDLFKIFAGRLQDWRRRTNMLIYIEREEKLAKERRIALACRKMHDALKLSARRNGFERFNPKLIKFLVDIIKSRSIKQMAKLDPKFNKLLLRRYYSIWRLKNAELRKKEFRIKFFNKQITNSSSNFRKNFLRVFFQKWFRNKPKNPLALYARGCELLKNHCLNQTIEPVINAFNRQTKILRKGRSVKISLKMKRQFLTSLYKNKFQLWRLKSLNLNKKEDRSILWGKLLNTTVKKLMLRNLANRLSFWRANIHEFKWPEVQYNRENIQEAFDRIIGKNHKLNDPQFFRNLKKHKSNPFMKRFKNKLVSFTDLADNIKEKRTLRLWNNIVKKLELIDLKKRFIGKLMIINV